MRLHPLILHACVCAIHPSLSPHFHTGSAVYLCLLISLGSCAMPVRDWRACFDVFRGLGGFALLNQIFLSCFALHLISSSNSCFGFDTWLFSDQKKEAMATDGGKAGGAEAGTKGKSSGSQVSQMPSLTDGVSEVPTCFCTRSTSWLLQGAQLHALTLFLS